MRLFVTLEVGGGIYPKFEHMLHTNKQASGKPLKRGAVFQTRLDRSLNFSVG